MCVLRQGLLGLGLAFTMELKMTFNFSSSCLHFLNAIQVCIMTPSVFSAGVEAMASSMLGEHATNRAAFLIELLWVACICAHVGSGEASGWWRMSFSIVSLLISVLCFEALSLTLP